MNKLSIKNAIKYNCEKCDFKCSKHSDWERHILTAKHQNRTKQNELNAKIYMCPFCDKNFTARNSLWYHKKKCIPDNNFEKEDDEYKMQIIKDTVNTDIFFEILKQNQDFKDLILEQNKQLMEQNKQIIELSGKSNFIANNNINSHNKTFNLNMFLNEKCKDALNIDEFVDSLKISLADLENLGENGFVNGVSRIFVNGLKNLDVYKRPIHCSDLKRETMYLKELNVWEKDNENKDKLRKVVKMISHKNMLKVKDWKEAYPQYNDLESKKNDQYLKILIGAAGPYNKEEEENCYDKIIKNIAKEVIIEKNSL